MGFLAQNQSFSIMFFFYKQSDLKIYATETMKEIVRIKRVWNRKKNYVNFHIIDQIINGLKVPLWIGQQTWPSESLEYHLKCQWRDLK